MKRVMLTICLLILLLGMGCMGFVKPVQRIPFPIEEYQALPPIDSGTATITGQAFMKTRGGDVKYAAGVEICLMPVTSYSNQWYDESYLVSKPITQYDSRYRQYIGTTMGDGEGRFEFVDVPAGDYYLSASIVWEYVSGGRYPSLVPTGGVVAKKVSVEDGQELKIILTR